MDYAFYKSINELNMNNIFNKSFLNYKKKWNEQNYPNDRLIQLGKLTNILENHFEFDKVNCIETGASWDWDDGLVGYYFADLTKQTGSKFISVDNDPNLKQKTIDAFAKIDPQIQIEHFVEDSVKFLLNTKFIPNLVHLDSYNCDLTNPLPSALHGWREFDAIRKRMPIGSIIVIDDNYYGGNFQDWFHTWNGKLIKTERIHITYPILGKGAHIYQYIKDNKTNWELLSSPAAGNQKVVIKKVSNEKE